MKTALAAASFTLMVALSGVSVTHAAGFNDQSVVSNAAASAQTGPQDLRHVPVVQGFNQQSHHAAAALTPITGADQAPAIAGAHCNLAPRFGFQNSTSFASC